MSASSTDANRRFAPYFWHPHLPALHHPWPSEIDVTRASPLPLPDLRSGTSPSRSMYLAADAASAVKLARRGADHAAVLRPTYNLATLTFGASPSRAARHYTAAAAAARATCDQPLVEADLLALAGASAFVAGEWSSALEYFLTEHAQIVGPSVLGRRRAMSLHNIALARLQQEGEVAAAAAAAAAVAGLVTLGVKLQPDAHVNDEVLEEALTDDLYTDDLYSDPASTPSQGSPSGTPPPPPAPTTLQEGDSADVVLAARNALLVTESTSDEVTCTLGRAPFTSEVAVTPAAAAALAALAADAFRRLNMSAAASAAARLRSQILKVTPKDQTAPPPPVLGSLASLAAPPPPAPPAPSATAIKDSAQALLELGRTQIAVGSVDEGVQALQAAQKLAPAGENIWLEARVEASLPVVRRRLVYEIKCLAGKMYLPEFDDGLV